jgi:hypothetical protein
MAGSIAAVVRAVAYVPGSPLLVPGLGGQADVLADLRQTCLEAIAALGPGPLVILGQGPKYSWYRGGVARFEEFQPVSRPRAYHFIRRPEDGNRANPLPPALGVGTSLASTVHPSHRISGLISLAGLEVAALPADLTEFVATSAPRAGDEVALLVVADGSARRGPAAPLTDDPRAAPWDDALAAALAAGHLDVDLETGEQLGATVGAWRAAAALTAGRGWEARLLAYEAPLGVAYLVATWL